MNGKKIILFMVEGEEDNAIALGAKWDNLNKCWYVPNDLFDSDLFDKWLPNELNIIVRNPFYIAVGSRDCWKCNKPISVIGFCSSNFVALEENEIDENFENASEVEYSEDWISYDELTFFQYVESLPDDIKIILSVHFKEYFPQYTKMSGVSYWANHCPRCRAVQGDDHLFDYGVFYLSQ